MFGFVFDGEIRVESVQRIGGLTAQVGNALLICREMNRKIED